MTVSKATASDAMHSVSLDTISGDAGPDAFLAFLAERAPQDPKAHIEAIMTAVSAELQARGWPDCGRIVAETGESWTYAEGFNSGVSYSPGWAFVQRNTGQLDRDNMLASAYMKALTALHSLSGNDVTAAFNAGASLQRALDVITSRDAHLSRVTIRKKAETAFMAAGTSARDAANRERHLARLEWVNEAQTLATHYWSRNPKAGKSAVALWLSRQIGRSANTIRKHIQFPEKS